jgi:hypothetical protein
VLRAARRAQAPIFSEVNPRPRVMEHSVGWQRVLNSDPVEISANDGNGFKVMTTNEYTAAWKVRLPCARLRSALFRRRRER